LRQKSENRTVIQAIKAKFSVKIFSWRQPECDRNTNLVCDVGKSAANARKEQSKKELGIFKSCFCCKETTHELHKYLPFLEDSERSWRKIIEERTKKQHLEPLLFANYRGD